MKILNKIANKVKKNNPKNLIKNMFKNQWIEMLLSSMIFNIIISISWVLILSIINNTNYLMVDNKDLPPLLSLSNFLPVTLILSFIFSVIIGYKMNKKIEREEMYILSEEEMLSFIKEDEEETLRNEIIDQFQKIIKTKGCVNYRDLLKVNKNIEIKRSNLLSIKNNQKQEKASICFGEKMRKELQIEEKIKDCV